VRDIEVDCVGYYSTLMAPIPSRGISCVCHPSAPESKETFSSTVSSASSSSTLVDGIFESIFGTLVCEGRGIAGDLSFYHYRTSYR
jgi:hypothetical protein